MFVKEISTGTDLPAYFSKSEPSVMNKKQIVNEVTLKINDLIHQLGCKLDNFKVQVAYDPQSPAMWDPRSQKIIISPNIAKALLRQPQRIGFPGNFPVDDLKINEVNESYKLLLELPNDPEGIKKAIEPLGTASKFFSIRGLYSEEESKGIIAHELGHSQQRLLSKPLFKCLITYAGLLSAIELGMFILAPIFAKKDMKLEVVKNIMVVTARVASFLFAKTVSTHSMEYEADAFACRHMETFKGIRLFMKKEFILDLIENDMINRTNKKKYSSKFFETARRIATQLFTTSREFFNLDEYVHPATDKRLNLICAKHQDRTLPLNKVDFELIKAAR